MKNKFFRTEFIFGLVIIAVLSLIPLLWFKGQQIIVGHDNVFPLQVTNFLRDRLFTWSMNHGVGYDQASGMGSIIIHLIDTAGYNLGTTLQTSEKITYIFWTFAMLFSCFLLAWFLEKWGYIKAKYFKFIFPVLYAFNFYTLQAWWIGERTKFSLMAAMPIFLLLLISLLRSKKSVWFFALPSAFLFTVFNGGGWKGLPLYGGIIVVIGTYVIYSIFFTKGHIRQTLTRYLKFFLTFILLFILINAYSIFPFFTHTLAQYEKVISSGGGPSLVFGWVDMISKDSSFINLFRFEGIPEWYNNPSHPYSNIYLNSPGLIFVSFLLPAFILLAFLFKKENQEKVFFLFIVLVLLISLFFTSGSHPPLGFLFNYLIVKIPGFAIFRTPIYKFGYAFWFAAGYIIAYALSKCIELLEKKSKLFIRYRANYLLTVAVIIGLIAYYFPFLTGNLFTWSNGQLENKVTIPSYIYKVANWADQKHDAYRILLLPRANTNWTADVYTWKFFSLYPLTADVSRQPFLYNNDGLTANESALVNGLYDAILNKDPNRILAFSRLLKTKYFIVRNDYFSSLNWSTTESPQQYTSAIKANPQFSVVKTFGKWDIYQLNEAISDNHAAVYTSIAEYNDDNFINTAEIESSVSNGDMPLAFLSNNVTDRYPNVNKEITDKVFSYSCITCELLTRDNSISFPKVWLYPDSPLYKISEILKSFRKKPQLFGETELFNILGRTLIATQQIDDMVNYTGDKRDQKDNAIIISFSELTQYYDQIQKWVIENFTTDQSKIYYSPIILNYLSAGESVIVRDLARRVDSNELRSKPYYSVYANFLSKYQLLVSELQFEEENTNYFTDKVFYPTIKGNFSTYLRYINNTIADDYKNTPLIINDSQFASISKDNNYISYGQISFADTNKAVETMHFSNLAQNVHLEKNNIPLELGSNFCVGSDILYVKQNQSLAVNYSFLNDFSDNLQLAIFTKDRVKNSPVLYSKNLSFDDKDEFSKQMTFTANSNFNDVFIGFCADEVNSYIFSTKLNLKIYPVVSPTLIAYQHNQKEDNQSPLISVNRVNQT
ncbi:MAG TPA: hypothetical protein VF820_06385, partial [Patescibacteria group bacterium]